MGKGSFKEAVYTSLPVLGGYSVLGFAFGLLVVGAALPWYAATLMSVVIFAGSGQFVLVGLLAAAAPLSSIALTTLMVNSRHMFYGLSYIEFFSSMGVKRWYMIFSLTDETYALLSLIREEEKSPEEKRILAWMVAGLNHLYWIGGSTAGALAGTYLPMVSEGVEFSMTALFIVILIEQLIQQRTFALAFVSFFSALLIYLYMRSSAFLFPSMVLMLLLLFAQYHIEKRESR
ncbi:MAG: AzlC family ABC transporter permease [Sphaerochaetaceae bacterium]|nr:AzlC family ABC transporter permease [Sphaerochaetaceae bacterium]